MAQNPFTFGHPVNDQALFIGRKNEIRQIVSRLRSSAHESTSIVGDSRMGNTSLLKHLSNPLSAGSHGISPDTHLMVYIDFQSHANISEDIFWKRVFTSIYRSSTNPKVKGLANDFRKMDEFDLFDLEDFFEEVNSQGITIVLMMDEFEYVTQSQNISGDFFGGLRSLAIHHNLPLVPATRHELIDLCHSEEIKGSPFFNIFATVHLGPFSDQDSNHMLEQYLAISELSYTEEQKNFIAYLGGGHPYFLQMAGYYWFYGREEGLEGQGLIDYMQRNYFQQSKPHLTDLWLLSTHQEQALLKTVASQGKGDPSYTTNLAGMLEDNQFKAASDRLVKRGLLQIGGGELYINLPCLEKFLSEEVQLEPGPDHRQSMDSDLQNKVRTEKYEVFISHSSNDAIQAGEIVRGLESRGIRCWIAPRDIQPGTPYPEAIINALNICSALLVIFSKAADDSIQVMQEVERAVAKRLSIIPIRVENALPTGSLELMLSSRHWLDAYNTPIEDHFDDLARTIRG
ncbi:MAG: TIR domain-containing protein [Chloroflexota bacterium]|nr:MAG: TIR domain-containing protein [Chloroflexota bacterium]